MKNVAGLLCKSSLALAIGFGFAASAQAATVSIGDATVQVGGGATSPGVLPVTFQGDGVTVGYQVTLTYDTANLDAVAEAVGSGLCTVNEGAGTVTILDGSANNTPMGNVTSCNVTFTVGAAAADGDVYTLDLNGGLYSDAAANPSPGPHTENDGQITVIVAPPDVVLGFNPTTNVVFPGGTSGDTTAASIAVSVASGTIGTGTIDNCVLGGANPNAFTIVSGAATVPPADALDLEVTLANTALSATLTCDLDDASAATQKVFQLSAPAGTPVPAPTYSSSPAIGTTLTCNGQPGATTQTSITVTNTGFAGVGSDLDITSCSTTGAGFSVIAGADPAPLAVGASTQITVQCTVPAEDQPAATGTLTCVHNDAANSPAEYPLSAAPVTNPPPLAQPNVVPASSLWSQLSLIGLMAALGLLVVGIRRK